MKKSSNERPPSKVASPAAIPVRSLPSEHMITKVAEHGGVPISYDAKDRVFIATVTVDGVKHEILEDSQEALERMITPLMEPSQRKRAMLVEDRKDPLGHPFRVSVVDILSYQDGACNVRYVCEEGGGGYSHWTDLYAYSEDVVKELEGLLAEKRAWENGWHTRWESALNKTHRVFKW